MMFIGYYLLVQIYKPVTCTAYPKRGISDEMGSAMNIHYPTAFFELLPLLWYRIKPSFWIINPVALITKFAMCRIIKKIKHSNKIFNQYNKIMNAINYDVKWAVYGAYNTFVNAYQVKDITAHLQKILDGGATSVLMGNNNFTDPIPNVHKCWSACVSINGRRYLYAGQEGETIDFTKLPINPHGESGLMIENLQAQLVNGGWPTPQNNFLFSNCNFTIANRSDSKFPMTPATSQWVSVDVYFSTSNSMDQTLSQLISIGDTPAQVNLEPGASQNIVPPKLFDISRFVTGNPGIIKNGTPYFLYAQVRSETNSQKLTGAFSTGTFTPKLP